MPRTSFVCSCLFSQRFPPSSEERLIQGRLTAASLMRTKTEQAESLRTKITQTCHHSLSTTLHSAWTHSGQRGEMVMIQQRAPSLVKCIWVLANSISSNARCTHTIVWSTFYYKCVGLSKVPSMLHTNPVVTMEPYIAPMVWQCTWA